MRHAYFVRVSDGLKTALLTLFILTTFAACQTNRAEQSLPSNKVSPPTASSNEARYGVPELLAELSDAAIDESSGIVASRRRQNIYWTHNDSGDANLIYAFDERGRSRGTWRVGGAKAVDWEDIAIAPSGNGESEPQIYIGDIGDNRLKRREIIVYRFTEPVIPDAVVTTGKAAPRRFETAPATVIRLRYPDGAHDAEALLVHPTNGDIYIIAKTFAATTGVYQASAAKLAANKDKATTMVRVAELRLPNGSGNLITGGEISPDGRRVVLCDYLRGYEIELPPRTTTDDFNQIWRQPIISFDAGARQQGEAICYRADGQAVLTTSEKLPTPLYQVIRD